MTHFEDALLPGRTLCGQEWTVEVMRSNPKADCVPCQDEWAKRTQWSFPLPGVVS